MSHFEREPIKRTERLDPRQKPTTLFFINHNEADHTPLVPWKNHLENRLQDLPKGKKIAVFTESVITSTEVAQATQERVADGMSPTEAYVHSVYDQLLPGMPRTDKTLELVHDHVRAQNSFIAASRDILDELAQRYPGIHWIEESHDATERDRIVESAKDFFTMLDVRTDPQSQTLDEKKEVIENFGARQQMRDQSIAGLITGALEEDDVVESIGWVGADHTGISHALVRDGYTANRVFPHRQGGTFYFEPLTTLWKTANIRELTDEEVEVSLQADRNLAVPLSVGRQADIQAAHRMIKVATQLRQRSNQRQEPPSIDSSETSLPQTAIDWASEEEGPTEPRRTL